MSRKNFAFLFGFFSLFVCSLPSAVLAEDGDVLDDLGFRASANVGFVSQYTFRGISQSNENPAVQGGFDLSHQSGFYAGVWGSNVDFGVEDETVEIDVYAGYSGSFKGVSYDVGAIYYAYPGVDSDLDFDFVEVSTAVGYDFDVVAVSASFNYSPNYFGDSGHSQYYAAGVDVPLPHDFNLFGSVGRQEVEDNDAFGVDDYTDWSIGVGYSFKGFDFSLAYVDTDLDEPSDCADGCEARVVFGVSKSF